MNSTITDHTGPATAAELANVAAALAANNIEVIVADGAEAKQRVLELIPVGAEVMTSKSKTLEDLGLQDEFDKSGRYNSVRARYTALDRATQGDEIRRLMSSPEFMVASVSALTEAGELVVASYSGSQVGPIASGAGRVLLVVGSQKIVPDLAAAMRRVREYALPYESARLREAMGVDSKVAKVLLLSAEGRPGRTTVILVREPIGV